MFNRKNLALLFALCFTCMQARNLFAQKNTYQFEAIDSRKGLSNNQVTSIFTDEKGFVWFGTLAGLNRYDGYNFKSFRHKPGDSTSINDDNISNMVQGPHQTLWVLTPNGWNVFDSRTEKFSTNVQAFVALPKSITSTLATIVPDKEGNFWFVCPGDGLYKSITATGAIRHYHTGSKELSLYANTPDAAITDNDGFLWIVYADGTLEKLDPVKTKAFPGRLY